MFAKRLYPVTYRRPLHIAGGNKPPEKVRDHALVMGGFPVSAVFTPECATSYWKVGQSLVGVAQTPSVQTFPAAHVVLHAPQWLALIAVSVQVLPQRVVVSLQSHLPLAQTSFVPQATPQTPQFCVLVVTSVQTPWQRCLPSVQLHFPEEQPSPVGQ